MNTNYQLDRHNLRVAANFVAAVRDERPGIQYNLWVTGAVSNIFDRDPPAAQEEFGYDPWTAGPLGRTIELGVKLAL